MLKRDDNKTLIGPPTCIWRMRMHGSSNSMTYKDYIIFFLLLYFGIRLNLEIICCKIRIDKPHHPKGGVYLFMSDYLHSFKTIFNIVLTANQPSYPFIWFLTSWVENWNRNILKFGALISYKFSNFLCKFIGNDIFCFDIVVFYLDDGYCKNSK